MIGIFALRENLTGKSCSGVFLGLFGVIMQFHTFKQDRFFNKKIMSKYTNHDLCKTK